MVGDAELAQVKMSAPVPEEVPGNYMRGEEESSDGQNSVGSDQMMENLGDEGLSSGAESRSGTSNAVAYAHYAAEGQDSDQDSEDVPEIAFVRGQPRLRTHVEFRRRLSNTSVADSADRPAASSTMPVSMISNHERAHSADNPAAIVPAHHETDVESNDGAEDTPSFANRNSSIADYPADASDRHAAHVDTRDLVSMTRTDEIGTTTRFPRPGPSRSAENSVAAARHTGDLTRRREAQRIDNDALGRVDNLSRSSIPFAQTMTRRTTWVRATAPAPRKSDEDHDLEDDSTDEPNGCEDCCRSLWQGLSKFFCDLILCFFCSRCSKRKAKRNSTPDVTCIDKDSCCGEMLGFECVSLLNKVSACIPSKTLTDGFVSKTLL